MGLRLALAARLEAWRDRRRWVCVGHLVQKYLGSNDDTELFYCRTFTTFLQRDDGARRVIIDGGNEITRIWAKAVCQPWLHGGPLPRNATSYVRESV